jgi:hypothetical protein
MVKRVFLSCCFFLTLLSAIRPAPVWHDTCFVINTHLTPDIVNKNITGVTIDFDYTLSYDKKHKQNKPSELLIDLHIQDAAGKKLEALSPHSIFCRNGFAGAEKSEFGREPGEKTSMHFFIPYYCLNLKPGEVQLQCSISIGIRDTSILEKERPVLVSGTATLPFGIHKPETVKVRLLYTGVRVTAKDHGKNWDFGLSGLPDPVFKVILANDAQPDFLYVSPEVQNSLSAAWIDPSPVFLISVGDKITLGIYDKDTLIDDFIGNETHTLEEWLDISKDKKELAFDQVLYCTVKAEQVK